MAETRVINGYELRQKIGEGGFGEVYRAFQPIIEREVAIKLILPEHANQPDFIRNFETEARLVARLEHPHIVPLFDYWRDPEGAYIVMRFLRGGNLRKRIEKDAIPPMTALNYLEQIASALALAHRNNVVHRDIKPDNILLDEQDNAYLSDFGIAKQTGMEPEDDSVSGSFAYMSPQQLRSESPAPSFDVYSLGVVLYEMVTGTHPFTGKTPTQMVMLHLNEQLPSIRSIRDDLSYELDDVIQKATAKDIEERYDSVESFVDAVRVAIGGTVAVPTVDPSQIVNPYKGLRAFDEADSLDFFGREDLIDDLILRLEQDHALSRFLAVVGPSGSGKSSVVHAGLIPMMRGGAMYGSESWFYADMVPGNDPIQSLAAALLSVSPSPLTSLEEQLRSDTRALAWAVDNMLLHTDADIVLVIDQFEEIFTQVEDDEVRKHFLEMIRHAVSNGMTRIWVIATLRADFYDRPLLYEGIGTLIQQRTQVVLPMTADEIERTITGPATRVGLIVEPSLAAAIVADVQQEPGALPLLQYVLTELFLMRQGNRLTLDAYQITGGVLGSLARRSDEVYQGLDDRQKAVARQVFLRLVSLGEGAGDTRRRVRRSELVALIGDRSLLNQVLDAFGQYRLLTFDIAPNTREPMVEVAHEAIIREWGRLREWLATSRDDIRLQRTLSESAVEWANASKDDSFLLRGTRLSQFEEWVKTTDIALTEAETSYVQQSVDLREREMARRRQRRNVLLAAGAVIFVVMAVLTGVALTQSQAAQTEADNNATAQAVAQVARETSDANAVIAAAAADEAQIAAAEAQSRLLVSTASRVLESGNTSLAIRLAFEAYQIGSAPQESLRVLASAAYQPGPRIAREWHEAGVQDVTYDPRGRHVASASSDQTVVISDAFTGEELFSFEGHGSTVNTVRYSAEGDLIASGDEAGFLIIWDAETYEEILNVRAHERSLTDLAFAPHGASLVTASDDGTLILWDVFTGEPIRSFTDHGISVWTVALSEDGTVMLTGASDGNAFLWDLVTGEILQSYNQHTGPVTAVAFSPDGRRAATGSVDNTVHVWDLATGEQIALLAGHTGVINDLLFSADGLGLYSGSTDGLIIEWDMEEGDLERQFTAHTEGVTGMALSPFFDTMLSSSNDATVIAWDLVSGAWIAEFASDRSFNLWSVDYSPDGLTALSGSNQWDVIVWDMLMGTEVRRLEGHTDAIMSISYSPDATRAVSGSMAAEVIVWDLAAGSPIWQFRDPTGGGVWNVDFSPDGRHVLTGADNGSLVLWNVETGEIARQYEGHTARARSVAISPDNVYVASGSDDTTLIVWDRASGTELQRYSGHRASVRSVDFSPDSTRMVSSSDDGTVIMWDRADGRMLWLGDLHRDWVTNVRFSPDGSRVVSASEDGSMIFWDVETGQEIWRYENFEGGIWGMRFSPDGETILTGAGSGLGRAQQDTLTLWRVDTEAELLQWITDNRIVPELSCNQRIQFGVTPLCEGGVVPTATASP